MSATKDTTGNATKSFTLGVTLSASISNHITLALPGHLKRDFGDFELECLTGNGGHCNVFTAICKNQSLQLEYGVQKVAIKRLKKEHSAESNQAFRFEIAIMG